MAKNELNTAALVLQTLVRCLYAVPGILVMLIGISLSLTSVVEFSILGFIAGIIIALAGAGLLVSLDNKITGRGGT